MTTPSSLPPSSPPKGVRMEILTLASDPPGGVRVAPGGGRVLTIAVLFRPDAGENPHSPAVVILDEGPGSHPTRWGEPTRWAAERLAAKGYTAVSLYSHMERGHALFAFDETAFEIDAALNALEARGYEDFVLAGHAYGALAAAHYLASRPDACLDQDGAHRVKAVVMINPLTELRAYPGADLGEGYEARMAAARASFDSGRGSIPAGNTLAVAAGPGEAADDWIASGPFVQPAELVLDYWGPDAARRNAELIATPRRPTLILAGGKDPTVCLQRLRSLAAENTADERLDLEIFPTADRFFEGAHDEAVEAMTAWLANHGLGVRPAVEVRFVDAATADGQVLPGVLYLPGEGADPAKPAFLMVHGRTGDSLFSSTHWMAWRLAQAGHAVLTPSLRVSGCAGIQSATTDECAEDLAGWMETLEGLGHRRVILTGHSNGGIWISNYVSRSHDRRVIGMVYLAPTATWIHPRERLAEPAFKAQYAAAEAAVASGKGGELVFGVLSAATWWDYNRLDTRNIHTERVAEFDLPALSIVGRQDALFTSGQFMAAFAKAYKGRLDEIYYDNGTHGLRENKDRVRQDILAWVERTF
jgi:pimeloyl-ACP methyl ester carboxylesterase